MSLQQSDCVEPIDATRAAVAHGKASDLKWHTKALTCACISWGTSLAIEEVCCARCDPL